MLPPTGSSLTGQGGASWMNMKKGITKRQSLLFLAVSKPQNFVGPQDHADRYWTDGTVQRMLTSLPSLQQLRIRSSPMISDQTLVELLGLWLFEGISGWVSQRHSQCQSWHVGF